jgi:hypothetical protein
MKNKIFTLLALVIMISISASSQTVKDNIDKLHKDKNTADRAAKADVLIHKKIIYDSTQTNIASSKVVSKKPVATKTKYKKHKYKKKTKVS